MCGTWLKNSPNIFSIQSVGFLCVKRILTIRVNGQQVSSYLVKNGFVTAYELLAED